MALPPRERTRLLTVLYISLAFAMLSGGFGIHLSRIYPTIAIAVWILAALGLVPPLLILLGHYQLSASVFMYQAPVVVFLYASILGREIGFLYFFLIFMVFPFLYYRAEEFWKTVVFFFFNWSLFLVSTFVNLDVNASFLLSQQTIAEFRAITHFSTFALCTFLFFIFYNLRYRSEQKLAQTRAEIRKAQQMKQDFLTTMEHEVRTPLHTVSSIADLMRKNPQREDANTLLNALAFSAANLNHLVSDLLDFSKLEVGQQTLERKPTDLPRFLQRIRDTYRGLADDKNLGFLLEIDPNLETNYQVDRVKVTQILGNLIQNAINNTERGKIKLAAHKVQEEKNWHLINFKVIHTGMGTYPASRAFSTFQTISTESPGDDLGLIIVTKLLKLFETELWIDNQPGKGSIASFDLQLEKVMVKKQDLDTLEFRTAPPT